MNDSLKQEESIDRSCFFDRRHLKSILESDCPELLCELYTLYLNQLRKMADELPSMSLPYDFENIQQLAHKMKSSSQSVGALRIAETLIEAETAAAECNNLQMQSVVEILLQNCIRTIGELEMEIMSLRERKA